MITRRSQFIIDLGWRRVLGAHRGRYVGRASTARQFAAVPPSGEHPFLGGVHCTSVGLANGNGRGFRAGNFSMANRAARRQPADLATPADAERDQHRAPLVEFCRLLKLASVKVTELRIPGADWGGTA